MNNEKQNDTFIGNAPATSICRHCGQVSDSDELHFCGKILETNNASIIGKAETETSKCLFCGTTYDSSAGHLCENPVGFRAIRCERCAELEREIFELKKEYAHSGLIVSDMIVELRKQNTALQKELATAQRKRIGKITGGGKY